MNEIVTMDGELIEPSTSMAVQLQKGEIDQMISTAKAYPRSLQRVKASILSMATLDEESAEECMYALPRGGKPIKGPSIRFAEILKQSYGNCRAAARVVHVDKSEGYVEAEGVFHDLETNSASTSRVRRRILDKNGRVFKDDMIIVTGNAACSIAMRNAILNGVPKPLWRKAYDVVQATIAGDITTLAETREKAIRAMATFGVKPERVFEALGVAGEEEIGVDHIVTLRGMHSALKNGEATVEEMFVGTAKPKSDHQKVVDPLADEPAAKPHSAPETREEGFDRANVHDEIRGRQEAAESDGKDGANMDADPTSDPSSDIDPDASASEHEEGAVSEADRKKLASYARDMFGLATGDAEPTIRRDRIGKAHARWKTDIEKMPAEAQEMAKRIFMSAQSINRGEADIDAAAGFFGEMLGLPAADLMPGGR